MFSHFIFNLHFLPTYHEEKSRGSRIKILNFIRSISNKIRSFLYIPYTSLCAFQNSDCRTRTEARLKFKQNKYCCVCSILLDFLDVYIYIYILFLWNGKFSCFCNLEWNPSPPHPTLLALIFWKVELHSKYFRCNFYKSLFLRFCVERNLVWKYKFTSSRMCLYL